MSKLRLVGELKASTHSLLPEQNPTPEPLGSSRVFTTARWPAMTFLPCCSGLCPLSTLHRASILLFSCTSLALFLPFLARAEQGPHQSSVLKPCPGLSELDPHSTDPGKTVTHPTINFLGLSSPSHWETSISNHPTPSLRVSWRFLLPPHQSVTSFRPKMEGSPFFLWTIKGVAQSVS